MKREILKPSLLLILLLAGSLAVAQDSIVVPEVADGGNGECYLHAWDSCGDGCLEIEYLPRGTDYKKASCPLGYFFPNGQPTTRDIRSFSCYGKTKIYNQLGSKACFKFHANWQETLPSAAVTVAASPDGGNGYCQPYVYYCINEWNGEQNLCSGHRPVGVDYQKLSCPSGHVFFNKTSGAIGGENDAPLRMVRNFTCSGSTKVQAALATATCVKKCTTD